MQKVSVEVKCHERVRQLSEPPFNQACDGVDNIVAQTCWLRICAKRQKDILSCRIRMIPLHLNAYLQPH